ncbi:DUF3017 domain-containing protein [Streptomyces sp. NPDC001820]|uniref:DUF3017 domain-containing protein n=1 Tax=Streptomyces sp. NPDC001820 TaxID=3364613 RepID=UPI0036C955D0
MGVRTNDAAGADDRGAATPLAGRAASADSAGATEPAATADGRAATEPGAADGRAATEPEAGENRAARDTAAGGTDDRDDTEPAASEPAATEPGAGENRAARDTAAGGADDRDGTEPAATEPAATESSAQDRPTGDADGATAAQPGADGHTHAAGSADGRDGTEPATAPEPGAEGRAAREAGGQGTGEPADSTADNHTGPHHTRTAPDVGAAVAAALVEAVQPRPGRPDDGDRSGNEARAADTGHNPDASQDRRTAHPAETGKAPSRRPPSLTRDTARPEGGGRAASGGAPAPARQWPLLTVLALTGLGLVIVGTDAFADAFRVGTILIGVALLTGAVLRRMLPSVGMLAVRSRFTDMVTYGLLGILIVLLALVTQPKPWLDVPFLEDAVHFTVR